MKKYIDHRITISNVEQGMKMLKVSSQYGEAGPGILSASSYVSLGFKTKNHCECAQKGIVAEGSDIGKGDNTITEDDSNE